MLDLTALFSALDQLGLAELRQPLRPLLAEKLSNRAHGNLAEWRQILEKLPAVPVSDVDLNSAVISMPCAADVSDEIREALLGLAPWRKGPFQIGKLLIDAEWRSDLKWERIRGEIRPLDGRAVLDVGCGNGYYALRMCGMGARSVIGIDPSVLCIAQHYAIRHFMPPVPVHLMPLRLQELPLSRAIFDTTFSMGVLYHQREPQSHLEQLRETLRDGGELLLETLILPGDTARALTPPERYARMRNVWLLPTIPQLEDWLGAAGFAAIRVVDVTATTTEEQRRTEWMPFESLAEALSGEGRRRTTTSKQAINPN